MPIIRFTLENKLIEALLMVVFVDLFDNMYDLVDALTFLFELTCELFKSYAVDFLDEILPSLDNFVSYGTDVFKACPDCRKKVLVMYCTAMTSPQLGDNDKINGCKLAESMLLNLHGHVDNVHIIVIAADHIDTGETASFHLAVLEIPINASAAPHSMEGYKRGLSCTFFERLFVAINSDTKLPHVPDKKLSILALRKVLEMDASAITEGLRGGWHGIVERKVLQDELVKDEDDTKYFNL
ncbi:hypothetical protein BDR03DRAFT_1042805 [Suillus americanus]|nr:hypothetical protein BDR03DRAFT_936847 [Suillus americanus]KAG2029686.1 hypothetical protein BDR03DRAFT_1042805 [Suillus americanus]